MPTEITTASLEVTVTTAAEMSPDMGITMTTATASTSGGTAEPVPVVSEGENVQASTSTEADLQERGMFMMAEQTATTSKVSFTPGELHQGGGALSQSLGASRESFISGESMLLGRGHGRGVCPTETPAAVPQRPGGQGEPHGPQPGTSGESGEPAPGSSGDSHELKKANETIKDLEGQVDSLVGIQNNLEIEMETQRVLVQEYEEDLRKLKCDNATVKAQLLTSEKKNSTLEKLLLEAEGKLREAGSDELDHWRNLAESQKNESTLLEVSLEAYKRALNDQVKNYHRLRVYTLVIEKHYQEVALNILMIRLPCPDDLLPQIMPIPLVPLPATAAAPVVVTTAAPPVTTMPPVMATPPVTMTTPNHDSASNHNGEDGGNNNNNSFFHEQG